ncbi:MAG: CDGSH iron-sulfur domain-containing protein [Clostridiales Family XIII bacterium]|jgi:CDGSH-type Zn-finger protein|nr:CDGSH iron-sulfur domain-containing protein [Clostridiales Family XIII bacterium]
MENGKELIKILKDGPYIVSGGVPLAEEHMEADEDGNTKGFTKGKAYEAKDSYSLCRCGHSEKKPYCDGTHAKIGFAAPEVANRACYCDAARVYEGGTIDLLDRPDICAVIRSCDRFQKAWRLVLMSSDDHPEYEQEAIYQANHCASGRITVRKDGIETEPELEKEIALLNDDHYDTKGPIYVKGGITLKSEDGSEYEIRNRRTLCRCGETRNTPFCDASHLKAEHMKGVSD